jgi:hypothetical protein
VNIIKEIEYIKKQLDFLVLANKGQGNMTDLTALQTEINKAIALAKAAGQHIVTVSNTSAVDTQVANLQSQLHNAMTELETILNAANVVTGNTPANTSTSAVNTEVVIMQKLEGALGGAGHAAGAVGGVVAHGAGEAAKLLF